MALFLATNRAEFLHTIPSPDPNRPDARVWDFANDPEPSGLNHYLTVTGSFEAWSREFEAWAEHSAEAPFLEAFAEAFPAAQSSVSLFVHGFNRDFKGAVDALGALSANLAAAGCRGALLGYDWPSAGGVLLYSQDRAHSEASVQPFCEFLLGLRHACNAWGARLNLVCHSMGNHLATLAGEAFLSQNQGIPLADTLLMLAPDVTSGLFDTDSSGNVLGAGGAGLCAMCSKIEVFYSRTDGALKASEGLEHPDDPRLGRVGPSGPLPAGVAATDASKAPYRIRNHGGYLTERAVRLWSDRLR